MHYLFRYKFKNRSGGKDGVQQFQRNRRQTKNSHMWTGELIIILVVLLLNSFCMDTYQKFSIIKPPTHSTINAAICDFIPLSGIGTLTKTNFCSSDATIFVFILIRHVFPFPFLIQLTNISRFPVISYVFSFSNILFICETIYVGKLLCIYANTDVE